MEFPTFISISAFESKTETYSSLNRREYQQGN